MTPPTQRKYDIVVFGANGYTARLYAQYLAKHPIPGVRWALAGRNAAKIEALRDSLKEENPDCQIIPDVQQCSLSEPDLDSLTKSTKILVNGVGPYSTYGEPVVKACAENGTGYFDWSPETPWIEEMIEKYQDIAKTNRARIIPGIGNSSGPSSILAHLVAKEFQTRYETPAREIICSFYMKNMAMSQGSLSTMHAVTARYGTGHYSSPKPFRLLPKSLAQAPFPQKPWFCAAWDPELGHLALSYPSSGNEAVVYRGRYLEPSIFHPDLVYHEYAPVSSKAAAVGVYLANKLGIVILGSLPTNVLRSLMKLEPVTPESGIVRQDESLDLRTVARGDKNAKDFNDKAIVRADWHYDGNMYYHSAVLAVEASAVLLDLWGLDFGSSTGPGKPGFGFLVPGCLGDSFVKRLKKVDGLTIEVS
ncbi:hypothetical protein Z517_04841 [Fonsecaea pedrosoi CBS 271.37]|uniref:Saccharopine dehydrogenase NADP binding domain-containing protein n=1 Tax=Fonsecaea pedrosoi CBS 271.37 TaxID=1442368 RepID=A0A0D2GTC4_9EURO|nr:uncharacterized protein Z517_04841 [Fonsecaea pedrosoi CBS 271.37]KIW81815.1 hypothetical protein Z517_04841 [Fonsecaea pedrosoi CBS 271.37]